VERFALEVDPGIVVPFMLLRQKDAQEALPVVVMVAQGGKAGFLKERRKVIETLLERRVVVCLVDVRGTGETQPGDGSPGRSSTRTSVSQTNLILGQPVMGSQLRDLRTVMRWLQGRQGIDGTRLAVWGDSFAKVNPDDGKFVLPLDAPELPRYAEPGASQLAILAALFEEGVTLTSTYGGLGAARRLWSTPYVYVPHDALPPGSGVLARVSPDPGPTFHEDVDAWNCVPEFNQRITPLENTASLVASKLRR
jgi:hypothetical protein